MAGKERLRAKGGFSSPRLESLFPLIGPDRGPRTCTLTWPTFRTLPVKNDTTHIHTMEYYSAMKRNAFESVLMRWVILEPVRQSGVSQKEKNKYCALTRIYGLQKDSTEEPICRAAVETRRREQTWML